LNLTVNTVVGKQTSAMEIENAWLRGQAFLFGKEKQQ